MVNAQVAPSDRRAMRKMMNSSLAKMTADKDCVSDHLVSVVEDQAIEVRKESCAQGE
jgi:hypothetical protein